jgi:hypothetical protein
MGVVERAMNGHMFAWAQLMRVCLVAQLDRCMAARGREFSFGSVLCDFMFERVVLLCPQAILDLSAVQDPRLMRWETLMP